MNNLCRYTLMICLCVSSLMSYALERGDQLPPQIPNVYIVEGYETNSIKVSLRMDGSISQVYAENCGENSSCITESFTVSDQTTFYLGNTLIKEKDVVRYSGKSGTVMFFPETHELDSLSFFNLGD